MSNERKPLLDYKYVDQSAHPSMWGAEAVRDHYERLIDEGKLRVVEEVEIPSDVFQWNILENDQHFKMPCCGHSAWLMDGWREWSFCPGCGCKIKRQ